MAGMRRRRATGGAMTGNGGGSGGDGRRYIEERTTVRVRFQEVDMMRIVWHGHYLAYFEEARRAFGRKWGLDYDVFLANGVAAPIVRVEAEFYAPARLGDELEVAARFLEVEGAKMEFEYEVRNAGGKLLAAGASVQAFVREDGTLLLTPPDFLAGLYRKWEQAGAWRG
ncbi:MAG: acyl-CoA thioesterase [Planctomycetota bacterium]|nr:acyl-CoA thioesterase [Planctomycetota bacterium]